MLRGDPVLPLQSSSRGSCLELEVLRVSPQDPNKIVMLVLGDDADPRNPTVRTQLLVHNLELRTTETIELGTQIGWKKLGRWSDMCFTTSGAVVAVGHTLQDVVLIRLENASRVDIAQSSLAEDRSGDDAMEVHLIGAQDDCLVQIQGRGMNLWEVESRKRVGEKSFAIEGFVTSLAIHRETQQIIIGTSKGEVVAMALASFEERACGSLEKQERVRDLAVTATRVVGCPARGAPVVWDLESGERLCQLQCSDLAWALVFPVPDSDKVLVGIGNEPRSSELIGWDLARSGNDIRDPQRFLLKYYEPRLSAQEQREVVLTPANQLIGKGKNHQREMALHVWTFEELPGE